MTTPVCTWRQRHGLPDLAQLHALHPTRYPHLLESTAHGTPQARYDILFAFPGEKLLFQDPVRTARTGQPATPDFLDAFDSAWRRSALPQAPELPFPFHGGWFVYLGYELARAIEPALAGMPGNDNWPTAFAQRFPAAVIRDHTECCTYIVCEHPEAEAGLLAEIERDLNSLAQQTPANPALPAPREVYEEDPALHHQRIARALEYIRAGDTFQVNLSRTWHMDYAEPPSVADLYRQLRRANPAPFACLLTIDSRRSIVSSSPERLACVRHGHIHTRPIAGTFPRSVNEAEDRELSHALVRDAKERAEHIMLVDLERNDLGRICRPGSVRADELLAVESYRHVHHIVSEVSGALRENTTPGQIIRAIFPGGTITGCPKIRTMQIISELEGAARGPYTGSAGYVNRDGSLDLNILIRTLVVDGNRVHWRAGGGIVADSSPEREIDETRAKAKGMLAAVGAGP
jgi:anthranilate synthase component 1